MTELLSLPNEIILRIGLWCLLGDPVTSCENVHPRDQPRLRIAGRPRKIYALRHLSSCSVRLHALLTPLLYRKFDVFFRIEPSSRCGGANFPCPLPFSYGVVKHLRVYQYEGCYGGCNYLKHTTLFSRVDELSIWDVTYLWYDCIRHHLRAIKANVKSLLLTVTGDSIDSGSDDWEEFMTGFESLSRLTIYSGYEFANRHDESVALNRVAAHLVNLRLSELHIMDSTKPFPFSHPLVSGLRALSISVEQVDGLVGFVEQNEGILHKLERMVVRFGVGENYTLATFIETPVLPWEANSEDFLNSLPNTVQHLVLAGTYIALNGIPQLRCFLSDTANLPNLRFLSVHTDWLDFRCSLHEHLLYEWPNREHISAVNEITALEMDLETTTSAVDETLLNDRLNAANEEYDREFEDLVQSVKMDLQNVLESRSVDYYLPPLPRELPKVESCLRQTQL
ncbi:hypothetical protein EMMF5_000297 [Cystobasidiomycetes sp. EMM_F5]